MRRWRTREPGPSGASGASGASVLGRLLALLAIPPARFALAAGLGAVTVLAGVALVGLAGYLICLAAGRPPILSLSVLVVAVRVAALARPLARYGERLAGHDLAFAALGHVRTRVFARIEPLAPAELEAYRDGELLSRMVADIDRLQDVALRLLLPVAVAAVAGVAAAACVWAVAPVAGILLAAGLLLAATVPPVVAARVAAGSGRRQAALRARLTADLVDALAAAEELWLNGADGRAAAAIADDDEALAAVARADARATGAADALGLGAGGLTSLAIAVATTAAAGRGALDPLLVAPLTFAGLAAFEAVVPLSASARQLPSLLAAGRRVLELIDREPRVLDPAEPVAARPQHTGIELRGLVVERGRAGHRVLDGAGLSLPEGDRLVVSGASGAGKTTLAHVLVRFLERRAGEAALGGHDLRDYGQEDLRALVLLSGQEPHVFASTIRANLAFARPGASDDALYQALDQARLGAWVRSLPAGLDTEAGEGGSALSGGQRQRLAMARAFLAGPAVLVLDEPTAHLDGATAAALLADLWAEAGDRSVLLIAHGEAGPFASCRRLELVATSSHLDDAGLGEARLHDRGPPSSA